MVSTVFLFVICLGHRRRCCDQTIGRHPAAGHGTVVQSHWRGKHEALHSHNSIDVRGEALFCDSRASIHEDQYTDNIMS